MGVGDDRASKVGASNGGQPYGKLVTPSERATMAKGSDRIARDRVRGGAPTIPVDNEEISGLIDLTASPLVTLQDDDKKTRKMEADQFRQLLKDERAKPVEPAPRKAQTTAELMTTVDDAFAEFGAEPEPAPPIKKQALIVADHRLDTRFAGAIAPITKPPSFREAPAAQPAPARSSTMLVLISVLVVAIIVGIAFVLLK